MLTISRHCYVHLDEHDRCFITRRREKHNRLAISASAHNSPFSGTFLTDLTQIQPGVERFVAEAPKATHAQAPTVPERDTTREGLPR
ncbi:DUF4158 domain-containing protein [Serratia fonticola]